MACHSSVAALAAKSAEEEAVDDVGFALLEVDCVVLGFFVLASLAGALLVWVVAIVGCVAVFGCVPFVDCAGFRLLEEKKS